MTNPAATARRAASALLLLGLLIVPPLLLASAVGWPLPTTIPSLGAIEDAARTGISDTVVVKVLACLAWLAWLQIAAAALLEIASIARHRPAPHLPVLPGLQPAITRLVAAALLVTATTARPAPANAAPLQPLAPIEAPQATAPAPVLPATPAPTAAPQPATRTITVERHDSYWAIAERTLGDGFRWREIRDLNAGRTMTDGTVLTPGSDLLHPGWTLQLPADPTATIDLTAPAAPALVASGVEVTVERGDGFWDIATEHVEAELGRPATDQEVQPYWSALIEANRDRLADANDPSLLFTGQVFTLVGPPAPAVEPAPPAPEPPIPVAHTPPAPHPAPTTVPPPTVPPASTAPTAESPVAAPSPDRSDDLDDDEGLDPIAAASAGFTALLAVGAARHLAQRRRRRAHIRLVADAPTPEEAADTHRQLLQASDAPAIDDLHGQLAALAHALDAAGADARPVVVQHSPDHLDAYLNAPLEAVPGWTAHPTNQALWTADQPNQPSVAADAPCPAPLLVTLGPPDGGGQLYLDLEAQPLVAVTGDPTPAADLLRSIAAELALSPLRNTLDLIVVGDVAPGDLADLDHVRRSDGWASILDELTTWAEQTHAALTANDWPNAFVGRAHAPDHDALGPVAVLADSPPPQALLDVLAEHPRAVLAVVSLGATPGALDLHCTADSLSIPALGLDIDPVQLTEGTLADLLDLLDEPDPGSTTAPFVAPQLDLDDVRIEPEPEIVVRLLGNITVDAGELKLSTKQTAVLSYIALHGPVASDRVENAIWAGDASPARRKRLSNTVSDLRALVGRNHLPAAADGQYEVGSLVATDLDLFERLVRRAAKQPSDHAADILRAALDLVRGPVFTYRTAERASYTWVDLENLVSRWELRVAAVAERCATLLLDHGRVEEAVDAATHALSILPTHPALTEVLMRAHAANGDRLAVQRVYQAHVASLIQLDLDDVAESTAELYERLARSTG